MDRRPFQVYWRCPSMVYSFLVKYICKSSDDKSGKEVKKFLFLLSTRIGWGSSMVCGGNPQLCLLICTHIHSPKHICQEFGTPSLDYYTGSNWACTDLRVDLSYLSSLFFHSLYWEWVLSCHQILIGIHDHKFFLLIPRLFWYLEKDVLSVLQLVGLFWRVVLCGLKWLFPRSACGWEVGLLQVAFCRMASQGSDNVMLSPCLPLLTHPLYVQV